MMPLPGPPSDAEISAYPECYIVGWPGTHFGDSNTTSNIRLSMQNLNAGTIPIWEIDVLVKFHGPI